MLLIRVMIEVIFSVF